MNAAPINLSERRRRSSATPDSSQRTTVDAPISIRLSSPNPASATDLAAAAATAKTATPTTFQPSVAISSRRPRLRSSAEPAPPPTPGISPVSQAPCSGRPLLDHHLLIGAGIVLGSDLRQPSGVHLPDGPQTPHAGIGASRQTVVMSHASKARATHS